MIRSQEPEAANCRTPWPSIIRMPGSVPAQLNRSRLASSLMACVALLNVSACVSDPDRPPRAEVVPSPNCIAPNLLPILLPVAVVPPPGQADAPAPGSLPDGFVPTAVVACRPGGPDTPTASGEVAVAETRYEGDLSGVLDALSEPSDRRDRGCTPSHVRVPALWLVDEGGRAIRPSVPKDECGALKARVFSEVEGLISVSETPHLLVTQQ